MQREEGVLPSLTTSSEGQRMKQAEQRKAKAMHKCNKVADGPTMVERDQNAGIVPGQSCPGR